MISAISVKDRLKNQAVANGKTFQEALTAYGLERTVYRLSVSEYVERFTLKGGIFLYALFEGEFARATRDNDLLARNIPNNVEDQYAAGTKEETLAGLKEIVPVIHDGQTKEIVENTIRKLEAIPEPECRRFITATKQHFIEKRDNFIRCRLAEAKAQSKAKKTAKRQKQPGRERP